MNKHEEAIGLVIDNAGLSFISCVDAEGYPTTKAMLKPRERHGIREIWFSTNTSSDKVKCFRQNNQASVYFVDEASFKGVSLVGIMEVIETAEAKERIWRDGDELFYKQGVTDPDYCVLKFTAKKCRFYCDFRSENIEIR